MTSLQTVVMGLVIVFLDIPPDGYDWIADPIGWFLVLLGIAALGERLPNRRGLVVTAWACLAFSVVSWPEGSPATLTPVLGWLFSLPTLAWCFLISDAVADAVEGRLRWVMLGLRNAFLVVAPLPGLVYLADQDWLSTPAEVLILVANLTLIFALSSASGRPGLVDPEAEETPGPHPSQPTAPGTGTGTGTTTVSDRPSTGNSTGSRQPAATPLEPSPAGRQQAPEPESPRSRVPDHPVTGAEVIEKVRRRRVAREKAQGQDRHEGE